MSLTSELDRRDGPVRRYIDECFVVPLREIRQGLAPELRERMSAVVLPPPPEVRGGALGTVGTAFDYRVRMSLEPLPGRVLVAHEGAAKLFDSLDVELADGRVERLQFGGPAFYELSVDPGLTRELAEEFFARLGDLAQDDEATLARWCLVLALFEEIYRAAGTPHFDSKLLHLEWGATLAGLLELPSAAQVADVEQLYGGFADEVEVLGTDFVCNPTFAGSGDIGGADADLLLGDCLLELKCSQSPNLPRSCDSFSATCCLTTTIASRFAAWPSTLPGSAASSRSPSRSYSSNTSAPAMG